MMSIHRDRVSGKLKLGNFEIGGLPKWWPWVLMLASAVGAWRSLQADVAQKANKSDMSVLIYRFEEAQKDHARAEAEHLKTDATILYFICRDPRNRGDSKCAGK